MKVIILSDLHIHNYQRFSVDDSRLRQTLQVLHDVFRFASKNQINTILFAGDLFDKQKSLPTIVVNETVETFAKLFKEHQVISFYAITGNHDLATQTSLEGIYVSALHHLSIVFPQFILIDFTIAKLGDGTFVYGIPYLPTRELFNHALDNVDPRTDVLLIHQTPDEFIEGEFSVEDERFNSFDKVFGGHIHQFKEYNNKFVMVGNPLHRDLGDCGSEKGFLIYDTKSTDIEFVSTAGCYPEFRRGVPQTDGNYWVPEIMQAKVATELSNSFSTDLNVVQLVVNYWREVDGKNEDLLKVGLSCITLS